MKIIMQKERKNKKAVIALSGGIDSSVSAALLKEAGFDVVGVFMKFWKAPDSKNLGENWNRCCSSEFETRARKVAKILNIPFYVFNFEREFKKRIVDYFFKENKRGLTPNPCVVCNKEIKFGLFLEKALKMNADFIATGHYACLGKGSKLLKAKDKEKDQSYFLWQLNQKQLKRVLFPIGGYKRKEVEILAKKLKLPFNGVKKSQEICFVPETAKDFLRHCFKSKPGKIIDSKGKILGRHQGLWFYTIGQRKGIKLPGGPYYVLHKDLKKNILIITKKGKNLLKKELTCKNVNWLSGKQPKLPLKASVKIRYRQKPVSAVIRKLGGKNCFLKFDKAQRAVTPGQSAVFYKGQKVLGGGIIS